MSCGYAGHFSTDLRGTDIYETKNCGKTDARPVFYRSVRVSTGSCADLSLFVSEWNSGNWRDRHYKISAWAEMEAVQ